MLNKKKQYACSHGEIYYSLKLTSSSSSSCWSLGVSLRGKNFNGYSDDFRQECVYKHQFKLLLANHLAWSMMMMIFLCDAERERERKKRKNYPFYVLCKAL